MSDEKNIEKVENPNMEVHHHPHVGKKKFKEYLLEGLMIFLAVSMGFIAENIRENISDREREREFMKSIITDIRDDITLMTQQKKIFQERSIFLDSLINLLNADPTSQNTNDSTMQMV